MKRSRRLHTMAATLAFVLGTAAALAAGPGSTPAPGSAPAPGSTPAPGFTPAPGSTPSPPAAPGDTSARATDLVVSAAVSLSEAFTQIGREFEMAHHGITIRFNFGASGQLLQQVAAGAPADVLVTADEQTMDRAARSELLVPGSRADIATNALLLIVPGDARHAPASLADLAAPDIAHIGVGSPDSVPAGRYAREALAAAGLWDKLLPRLVYGQNVRQVLDYVARGEVDAGFVYRTDVRAAHAKVKVAALIPTSTPILYSAAAIRGGNQDLARLFLAFVASTDGREVLAHHGFGKP